MKPHTAALVLLFLFLAACAGERASSEIADVTPRANANQLTRAEIAEFQTAFQAVQGLRSGWFRRRSTGGAGLREPAPVWVYHDGTRLGGVETLSNMPTATIASMQYYNAAAASYRWGVGHENGVIHVTSRIP
jgi:hypothetical protein